MQGTLACFSSCYHGRDSPRSPPVFRRHCLRACCHHLPAAHHLAYAMPPVPVAYTDDSDMAGLLRRAPAAHATRAERQRVDTQDAARLRADGQLAYRGSPRVPDAARQLGQARALDALATLANIAACTHIATLFAPARFVCCAGTASRRPSFFSLTHSLPFFTNNAIHCVIIELGYRLDAPSCTDAHLGTLCTDLERRASTPLTRHSPILGADDARAMD